MNGKSTRSLIMLGCVAASLHAHAYNEVSHKQMSEMAFDASVLASQDKLKQLGLIYGPNDVVNQKFPVDSATAPLTVRGAVSSGSVFEDSGFRVVNHFFNPLSNGALSIPLQNATSPDWALEDNGLITSTVAGSQKYSYRASQGYLLDALVKPTKAERDKNWGLTFQTLGQVIHHLQDMAQPQHVRNDMHLDVSGFGLPNIPLLTNPSTYELWVFQQRNAQSFAGYAAYGPAYSPSQLNGFTRPRQFWTTSSASVGTSGSGIAEYTNRNFFSQGTLWPKTNIPAPVGTVDEAVDTATLCANAVPQCPAGVSGMMSFTHTTVTDNLRPSSQDNSRGSAFSIYTWDLKSRNLAPIFTLNRFTYDKAAEFLIPRAVSYSAGLLNFFFRGQMNISLPNQGVYAVVDHTLAAGSDKTTGGFSTIKLKVQNTTPGTGPGGVEPMGNGFGKLYAVVKFHRNLCYQANLQGEYGSPGTDWKLCRSPDEEIAVSTLAVSPTGIDSAPQEVTFNFPTPVPISGTDMFLQVVYDGQLGDETRAIVVATKDISEPTYRYNYDIHDQFMYAAYPALSINGGGQIYTWTQWSDQAIAAGACSSYPDCNARLWPTKRAYQFSATSAPIPGWDPANPPVPQGNWFDISLQPKPPQFNPVVTLSYPTGSYARVAFLTDAAPTNFAIRVDDWNGTTNHQFSWMNISPPVATNQVDLLSGAMITTQTWAPARGAYFSPSDAQFIGTPTNVGPLVPSRSNIP